MSGCADTLRYCSECLFSGAHSLARFHLPGLSCRSNTFQMCTQTRMNRLEQRILSRFIQVPQAGNLVFPHSATSAQDVPQVREGICRLAECTGHAEHH